MSNVYLIAVFRCDSEEEYSLLLLRHFIRHYLTCGINHSNIKLTIISNHHNSEIENYAQSLSIDLKEIVSCQSDACQIENEKSSLIRNLPEDTWIITPNLEEFIAFPKPVSEIISEMEKAGYDSLTGHVWDRLTQNMSLKQIEPEHPIHLQFPIAVDYSANVLFLDTRRNVLMRRRSFLEGRTFNPAPSSWEVLVDSYKWTTSRKINFQSELLKKTKTLLRVENQDSNKSLHGEHEDFILAENKQYKTLTSFPKPMRRIPSFRFIHIPKTAGTSVFKVVKQWFPEIHRIIAWHKLDITRQMSLNHDRFVFGHIPLRHLSCFGSNQKNVLWFTILRNPIEQAISCYYEHARNLKRRPLQDQQLINEGLEALLLSGRFHYLWPSSVHYLSTLPKDVDDQESLESAKQNLKKFTIVGFYDEIEIFIKHLAVTLDRSPPDLIPHANYNPSKPDNLKLSNEAKCALEQFTALDMDLYNYANHLFR